jgi:ketosteroid isomerase-like protein
MTLTSHTAHDLAQAYYASWENGIQTFDEARLRSILDPDLLFEGPIAGSRRGAEGFLKGLRNFVESVRSMHRLQSVYASDGAAFVYDADIGETMRFAEFIGVANGRITSIRLVYDAAEFRRLHG